MWFPDDVWYTIKEFWGVEKYYLVPSEEKRKIREQYAMKLSEKCFTHVIQILKPTTTPLAALSTYLPACLFETCLYLVRYNDWIQIARQYCSTMWDRFSVLLATQCNNCLLGLVCLSDDAGGRCGACAHCRVHCVLERMSRTFYTGYMFGQIGQYINKKK